MITENEKQLALDSIGMALEEGAQHCRINLSKNTTDIVDTLDGELDKLSHCLDRGLTINLFVDGRFGSFSTNRLDREQLRAFIREAVAMTRLLAPDGCRRLPEPSRCCTAALTGDELGLYDPAYSAMDAALRREMALRAAIFGRCPELSGAKLISEEGEYSDSEFDSITADSNGLFCRHLETSFEYVSQVTVEASDGRKYSGYWWESSPRLAGLDTEETGRKAVARAMEQIGSAPVRGGKYTMVVDSEVASKLLTPVLNALGGYSLQQNNSFMADTLDKAVFSEAFTVIDDCLRKGESGSRLFDSEGVATRTAPVIEKGVVKQYFINTYIAGKMGLSPTVEDCTRAHLLPYPQTGLDRAEILRRAGSGILVTGFNGGNCNSATGDFSYGVEGFRFENGVCTSPVSGMLVTGNFLKLWSSLVIAGDDTRSCQGKLVPTLCFEDVDFNG